MNPHVGRVPVREYVATWIAERPNLAPRSVYTYEGLVARYIEGTELGLLDLADVTAAQVRMWRADRLAAGVGEVSVAKAYRLLRAAFNTAVDDGLIGRNPCRIVGAGIERSPERRAPTMEEVFRLADVIGPRWRALVLLAAFGALRWGELAGLRRLDIDLDARTVRISASVIDVRGSLSEGPPKSKASRRVLSIPQAIVPDLARHMGRWSEPGREGRVFVGPRGGALRRSSFQRVWAKARVTADLPTLRFHDLRHAGATWAAATGAGVRELMGRLGHSTSTAALIYQHTSQARDRAVADALSQRAGDARQRTLGHDRGTTISGRITDAGGSHGLHPR